MQTEDLYIHHCDHANDQNHVLGHWQGTQGVVSCARYNDDDDDDDDDDDGDDDNNDNDMLGAVHPTWWRPLKAAILPMINMLPADS